jgi:hypothetical protein
MPIEGKQSPPVVDVVDVVDVDDLIESLTKGGEEEQSNTASTGSLSGSSDMDAGEEQTVKDDRLTRVGFTFVQIRSFDRIVGDHPDVRNGGPPLSIGWDYVQGHPLDLDDYENYKAEVLKISNKPWMFGLRRLSSGRRRDVLKMFDATQDEIEKAEAEVRRVQKLRQQTNKQTKMSSRTEEMVQSAKRKVKRTFSSPRDETDLIQPTSTSPSSYSRQSISKPFIVPLPKPQPVVYAVSA